MKNGHKVEGDGMKASPYIVGVYGFRNNLETGLVLSDINNWHDRFLVWVDSQAYHEVEQEYVSNTKPLSLAETQKLLVSLKARDAATQELNSYFEYKIVGKLSDLLSFHHPIVKYCPIQPKLDKDYSILVLTGERSETNEYLVVDVLQDKCHYVSRQDLLKLYKPSKVSSLDADDKGLIAQYLGFFTTKFQRASINGIVGVKRYTYAAEYTYGATMCDDKGRYITNIVYRFEDSNARDEWIAKRKTDFFTDSGYRGRLPARAARTLGFVDYVA